MIEVIYAQNGTGKTLECETLMVQNTVLFPNRFLKGSGYKFPTVSSLERIAEKSGEEWDLDLKPTEKEAFLKVRDILNINKLISFIGIKIYSDKEVKLKDVVLKRGNRKFGFLDALPSSAGEEKFLKTVISLTAYWNVAERVIIDDPIELSSYRMEMLFVEFIKDNCKVDLLIYTHNYSLFKLFGRFKKSKVKLIYWIDDFKYSITGFSYDKKNDFIKRVIFDKIKLLSNAYDLSMFWKNVPIQEKRYVKSSLSYGEYSHGKDKYLDYVSSKIYYFQLLRSSILTDSGLDPDKNKLKDVKSKKPSIIKDAYFFEKLCFILNQSLHYYGAIDQTEEVFMLIETIAFKELIEVANASIYMRTSSIKAAMKKITSRT